MKLVLTLSLLISSIALAQTPAATPGQAPNARPAGPSIPAADFEKRKKEMLEGLDKNITMMQEHRKCLAAAKNFEGFQVCNDKMREARNAFRASGPGGPGGLQRPGMSRPGGPVAPPVQGQPAKK